MTVSEKVKQFSYLDIDQVTRAAKNPRKELAKLIQELEVTLEELKTKIAEQEAEKRFHQTELDNLSAKLNQSNLEAYEQTALDRKDHFTVEKIRKIKRDYLEKKETRQQQIKVIQETIDLFYRDRNLLEAKLSEARSRYQVLAERRQKYTFFFRWLEKIKTIQLPSPESIYQKIFKGQHQLKTKENNGVFALIAINFVLFILDEGLKVPLLQNFYLDHDNVVWYQLITSMFCHADWQHLSGNLFFLYIFGKLVEEEEGAIALIISYLVCGLGANLMSLIFQPNYIVSLGASGAVFGLFTVSVLLKLGWHWRRLLEVIILGQFVIQRLLFELQNLDRVDGINRIAHVGGALAGVALIWGLKHWQEKAKPRDS